MAKPVALVAFDSFKGSASAAALCAAAADALPATYELRTRPLSDGGDGFAEVLEASCPTSRVLEVEVGDALGRPSRAAVPVLATSRGEVAVVEAARACGLAQLGGPSGNDPVRAGTRGVGELIAAAVEAGVTQVVVGCGGSASTDGGLGAIEVLEGLDLSGVDLEVAVDVGTTFVDAARVFGPQKGATPAQVESLTQRLRWLAVDYAEAYATAVERLPGSGAAGGLAGGLAAIGGRIGPGFDLVAELVGLEAALEGADLVLTGEGRLDASTLEGKVVARLAELVPAGVRLVVLAGQVEPSIREPLEGLAGRPVELVDLSEGVGTARCLGHPLHVLADAVAKLT